MKIEKKQIDALNIELTMGISAEDYAEAEKKRLSERRRTADFKGFRKGNVPASLIKKVYGGQCLVDAVNDVISEGLQKFITDNSLNILGEPLQSEKQKEIVWESGNDFEFVFDIATYPEIKLDVTGDDSVNRYQISVSAKAKEDLKANLKKYYEEKKEEKSDADIDKEVSERLENQYAQESEWRLTQDIRNYFVNKAAVELPEAFLKRWLLSSGDGKVTQEQVEQEFDAFKADFKWQLVRGALMKKFGFEVTEEEVREAAHAYVTYQYAMYGIGNVPQDMIEDAVKNVLRDRRQIDRMVEQVEDRKVLDKIRETISIKDKKITSDKFRELK